MLVSQHTLLQELKKLNYDAKVQEETSQIYFTFTHEKQEFPLFLRLIHDGELLQLLTFIPCNVKPEHVVDVARFLHMLNKELDVPGFCLDEISSTIFYRIVYPSLKKQMPEETFEALLSTSQMVVKTFSPAIVALSLGLMTMEDVLKSAQRT